MEANPAVIYRSAAGIAEIRFNRPKSLNALDLEVALGFREAVTKAVRDETIAVIVLSAEGRAFVAGGDLATLRAAEDRPAAARALIEPLHEALLMLAEARAIVLASVKGAVAGAGMSLALAADLTVAADDARFNLAYQRIAATPDCSGSFSLPRLVGLRRAMEIALLCETIDAPEALRLGLVNRVVPAASLEAETAALARRLADGPALAQGRTKRLLRRSLDSGLAEQLEAERESFEACAGHADFEEALAAFFEKRKPSYRRP